MSIDRAISEPADPVVRSQIALTSAPSRLGEAIEDLAVGFNRRWIWTRLAYQDIRERYRGSVLGPFWVTLTNLVMIAAMGAIYSELFHVELRTYVPYIMTGILTWQFISGLINEGCTTFTNAQDVIQQVPMPFSVQVYRVVYRNLLVLLHSAIIIPVGLFLFRVPVDWRVIEVFPAIIVLSVNGFWIAMLLGIISSRFRDIPPIVANIVQVLFFLTPIFWPLDSVRTLRHVLALNPFFAWIDVVRAPLLGAAPEATSWPLLLGCTAAGGIVSLSLFVRFRERIAYWL